MIRTEAVEINEKVGQMILDVQRVFSQNYTFFINKNVIEEIMIAHRNQIAVYLLQHIDKKE